MIEDMTSSKFFAARTVSFEKFAPFSIMRANEYIAYNVRSQALYDT
jgi:hypothetical protein